MAVSNTMVQTNVDTVFTDHGKEDGIFPPRTKNTLKKEIAKAQNKDQ